MIKRILLASCIIAITGTLSACINLGTGRSPATKFYMLATELPEQAAPAKVTLPAGFSIGVGPVRVPRYLSLPMLVTRTGPHEMQSDEFHQWAEPLPENITRVMSSDLLLLTGAAHAFAFPWRSAIPIDVQVIVNVMQFDVAPGGNVILKAQWSLLGDRGKQVWLTRRSAITRPAPGGSHAEQVAGVSAALTELTREIAAAIMAKVAEKRPAGGSSAG